MVARVGDSCESVLLEESLDARAEAVRRMNEALDSELPQMVSDVDAIIERQRRNELMAVPPRATTQGPESPCDDEEEMVLPSPIGAETALRLKKAKAKVAEKSIFAEREREFRKEIQAQQAAQAKMEAENKQLRREITQLRAEVDKENAAKVSAEDTVTALKRELHLAERAVRDAKKEATQAGSEHRTVDVRLARALEDADKAKALLEKEKRDRRDEKNEHRQEKDKLQASIRKLDHQKAELLNAFKKQLKLIDVLKRQKTHMEAARLLAFTEDEFVKLVGSWGGGDDNKGTTSRRLSCPAV